MKNPARMIPASSRDRWTSEVVPARDCRTDVRTRWPRKPAVSNEETRYVRSPTFTSPCPGGSGLSAAPGSVEASTSLPRRTMTSSPAMRFTRAA